MKIRSEVAWFAEKMEEKLRENDSKGGWDNCDIAWLLKRLREETTELAEVIAVYEEDTRGIPGVYSAHKTMSECADVANFAMMIADLVRRGSPE
jgi:NTP pyrophosphatase (non-canonical NTP hydrolase)